jgi:hypothetical protein
MGARFDMSDPPPPWGGRQPKFERLERDDAGRFFLVYKGPSGEELRVEIGPARASKSPRRRTHRITTRRIKAWKVAVARRARRAAGRVRRCCHPAPFMEGARKAYDLPR